ncbi:gpW family head-tail joining protein, partial [Commensalibacter papalotli (ex Botero et al. 2024)]
RIYLDQAQQAYNDLLIGNKPISVSYSQETGAKSVTYTQANLQQLQGYILELQRTLGINRRRAMRIRFR